jgi:DNA polymerase (family X)
MTNKEVARVLYRIAALMEFSDENPFKVRSYRMAAETAESLTKPLSELAEEGGAARLKDLPGIGDAISQKILEILSTGTCDYFEELKKVTPESVLDLTRVDAIGPKMAHLLYQQFHVSSLTELAAFVESGGLARVPRLGPKMEERIRTSLQKLADQDTGELRM